MTNTPPTIVIVGAGFAWRSFGGDKRDRTADLLNAIQKEEKEKKGVSK